MKLSDYSRIQGAVDTQLLAETHIVGIGAGGACKLYEGFVRSGLGKLTVFDFDEVDESNLSRQGYETSQIGKKKVDALGESLAKINTGTEYQGITDNFLDMSIERFKELTKGASLILFLTDSFEAQSMGNKLALELKIPALWGGFYEKSRCAEIVFTIPGVTPACFRCAVSPRYEAQQESTEEIKISSSCNTIFHSELLDAQIGMLSLAILHNNTVGFEFSNWFGTEWKRNLLQFKVHPSYGTQTGSLFERTLRPTEGRAFTFNAIWQELEAECPPEYKHCPDCGGTGDLLNPRPPLPQVED